MIPILEAGTAAARAPETGAPPRRRLATPRTDASGFALRIGHCRAALGAGGSGGPALLLQLFDLARMRARLGWRWDGLRPRAFALLQASLRSELGPADLALEDGADRLFLLRAGADRRQAERHAGLIAGEVTAKLCGTIPGGAIIRVVTLAVDPENVLDGLDDPAGLLDRLRDVLGEGRADPETLALPAERAARFRPVLNLRKRLVSAYRLTATAGGGAPDAEAAWGGALDGWAVRQAADLLRAPRRRAEPALILPVHYHSLATRAARDGLMPTCRELPPRSSRQLAFELVGMPPDLPEMRLRELTGYLRPFCLALLLRVPGPGLQAAGLVGAGVRGVTLAARHAGTAEALAGFAGTARVHGLRSMLVDLDDPRRCREARAAGVDHVWGDGLLPPLPRPGRAFRVA